MKKIFIISLLAFQLAVHADWDLKKMKFDLESRNPHEIKASCSLDGSWKVSDLRKGNVRPDVKQAMKEGFQNPQFTTGKWHDIEVPHNSWHKQFPHTYPDPARTHKGYSFNERKSTYVDGWFSKEFSVPSTLKGNRVYLKFGAVGWESHIWVNGKKVGEHRGSFTGFKLDITELVQFDKTNSLRIWVYNDFGERPIRHPYGKMFFSKSNVGGIVGAVELEALPPVNVSRCLITPYLNNNSIEFDLQINKPSGNKEKFQAYIILQGEINGKKDQSIKIDAGTVELAEKVNSKSLKITLKKPILWTPEHPYLYNAYIILRDLKLNKNITCYRDRFGFREFIIKGNKFFLNAKRVRLYCGNIRTAGSWNTYDPQNKKSREYIRRQKRQGANTIRYHMGGADSHRLLAMADEEGVFVISEFPLFHRVVHHFAFKSNTAREEFLGNVFYEWKERLYRDYNHPSCVVWSLSNEVWTDSTVDELNDIYSYMKPLDKQKRPMSAGSGIHSFGIPTLKVKTDFWDAHLYNITSRIPYTYSKVDFDIYFNGLKKIYGKLDRPSAAFECLLIGAGRPKSKLPFEKEISIEEYLKLLKAAKTKDVSYMGLRHLLDWRDNGRWLADNISKKAVEEFRKETRLQGFHPWWPDRSRIFPAYKIITSPFFIGAESLPKNQFSGKNFKFNSVLIKDPLRELNASCSAEILDKNGKSIVKKNFSVNLPADQDKTILPMNIPIPSSVKSGFYTLNMELREGSKLWNHNFYDIYILNPNDLPEVKSNELIAVYGNSQSVNNILKKNKVKYEAISDFKELKKYKRLVVNVETDTAWKKLSASGNTIREWVKKGNRLLMLEIPCGTSLNWIFSGYEIKKDKSGFDSTSILMEPAVRKHPVFNGLTVNNFDTLNGNNGLVGNALIYPLSKNLLGTGFPLSKNGPGGLLYEAKLGRGSCMISQLMTLKRYEIDSSAALYMNNLLNYFFQNNLFKEVKPLDNIAIFGVKSKLFPILEKECHSLDISNSANRDLCDKIAKDGKGGWTDGGHADFRQAPIGENLFMNIPYSIIDPAKNKNKAAIILKGARTPEFPEKISITNIDRTYRRLFFFHTTWFMKANSEVMDYIVNYADGSKELVRIFAGRDIGDWYAPSDLSNAAVAWSGKHPIVNAPFGFYVTPWENPEPDKKIESIDIISKGESTPIVLAVSGQDVVEFASQKEKPWDFSRPDNIEKMVNLEMLGQEKGLCKAKMTASHAWLGFNLYGNKLDAGKWKRLKFDLKSTAPVVLKVICFSPSGDNATSSQVTAVKKSDGWYSYDIDLENIQWPQGTSPEAKQWGGRDKTVISFALDFTAEKDTIVELKPVGIFKD